MSKEMNELLASLAKPKKKTKSTVREVELRNGLVEDYCKKQEQYKSLKSEIGVMGQEIIRSVESERGNEKSLRAVNNGRTVLVSWTNRFPEIAIEKEGDLRDWLGNKYNRLFKTVNTITVKKDIKEEQLRELIQTFPTLFEVKQVLRPTEEFDERKLPVKVKDKICGIARRIVVLKAMR